MNYLYYFCIVINKNKKVMTRINSAIKVKLLVDEHLLAEHRELPRICSVYKKRLENKTGFKNIQTKFSLGTGHVLFFADKGGFTLNRYREIYRECVNRGFNVTNYEENWSIYGSNLKDYRTSITSRTYHIEAYKR